MILIVKNIFVNKDNYKIEFSDGWYSIYYTNTFD